MDPETTTGTWQEYVTDGKPGYELGTYTFTKANQLNVGMFLRGGMKYSWMWGKYIDSNLCAGTSAL